MKAFLFGHDASVRVDGVRQQEFPVVQQGCGRVKHQLFLRLGGDTEGNPAPVPRVTRQGLSAGPKVPSAHSPSMYATVSWTKETSNPKLPLSKKIIQYDLALSHIAVLI